MLNGLLYKAYSLYLILKGSFKMMQLISAFVAVVGFNCVVSEHKSGMLLYSQLNLAMQLLNSYPNCFQRQRESQMRMGRATHRKMWQ